MKLVALEAAVANADGNAMFQCRKFKRATRAQAPSTSGNWSDHADARNSFI